jgi:thioredoxin:protein disulfide reductase
VTIERGETATQTLRVTVLPGFHVNSDKPKDEFLIPLKLTWTDGPLEAKSVTYPQPEEIRVGKNMLLVFTGNFTLETEFKASDQSAPGASIQTGKLRYQACNNEMCFRPASIDIHVPVVVQ